MKILIVDDSKLSRAKIKAMLRNHETIEAENGLDAVLKFKEFKPDIIIADYEMPKMNGLEMAEKILEMDKNAKIIFLTSIIDKKVSIRALKLGVKAVLYKPVKAEELLKYIEEEK